MPETCSHATNAVICKAEVAQKKTSKHGCFRTQSKSSFVSIMRFFCSSSKSVWSYLNQHNYQIKMIQRQLLWILVNLGFHHKSSLISVCVVYTLHAHRASRDKWKQRHSYSLIAAQNITAETPSNRWIHFLLSFLWPPTSKSLYTSPLFLCSPTGLPKHG